MPLELQLFCNNLEGTKPPYECPICLKIYRSLPGIKTHLNDHQLQNASTERQQISQHLECNNNFIDIDIEGKTVRLGINDPMIFQKINLEASSLVLPHKQEKKRASEVGPSSPSSNKIPDVQFRIDEDYAQPIIRKIPKNTYYRYIEPSQEELEEEIQYDIDDEDEIWLEELNKLRVKEDLVTVTIDTLEWTMDRFEKKWYFKKIYPKRENGEPSVLTRDEDALCCICLDGECHQHNTILFCDLCNLAVHQECYGVPHIPEGPWICRRCLLSPSKAVSCCLCLSQSGAFKQTDDGRWAHVICALFVPDVGFANPVFLEPIDGIERVAPARWKLTCQVCRKRRVGACIQCHRPTCYSAFHATCAQMAGLHLKLEPVSHTESEHQDGARSSGMWSGASTLRRSAYCELHTSLLEDENAQQDESIKKKKNFLSILEGNLGQILSIPVISEASIQEMINNVPGFNKKSSITDKKTFVHRALAYWKLKRKARNGVPLTSTPPSRYVKKFKSQILVSPLKINTSNDGVSMNEILLEELNNCKQLRRDLEKVRLLNELIKKREKLKTEMISLSEELTLLKVDPFSHILKKFIESVKELENISNEENKLSSQISEIEENVSKHIYSSIESLQEDLNIAIEQQIQLQPDSTSQFHQINLKIKTLITEYKSAVSHQVDLATGLQKSPNRITKKSLMQQFLKEKCFDFDSPNASSSQAKSQSDIDVDLSVKSPKQRKLEKGGTNLFLKKSDPVDETKKKKVPTATLR